MLKLVHISRRNSSPCALSICKHLRNKCAAQMSNCLRFKALVAIDGTGLTGAAHRVVGGVDRKLEGGRR
jgi:hypothetical protein